MVEKKTFPRVKTCGDGLTPRSVRQIADMDRVGVGGFIIQAVQGEDAAGPSYDVQVEGGGVGGGVVDSLFR